MSLATRAYLVALSTSVAWCDGDEGRPAASPHDWGREGRHVAPSFYVFRYPAPMGCPTPTERFMHRKDLCSSCAARTAQRYGLELPPQDPGVRRRLEEAHATAAGSLCLNDGSGCCGACGVSLSTCPECRGLGYHRHGCQGGGL